MADMLEAGLHTMSPTRRRILDLVKKSGETRAESIAGALGMSVQGTRQHLSALERDGLIAHREHRDGLGRPKYRFFLTPSGDALFPRAYAQLANDILDCIAQEDPVMSRRVFERLTQRRILRARERTSEMSFPEKVRAISAMLDEDGYLAELEERDDGSFLIREHNCAVLNVAVRHAPVCTSELAFLQAALPEAEVTRVAHRIAGGHVCAYRVRPAPPSDQG